MTWQELADFINNVMPEGERDKDATVWDASLNERSGGHFFIIEEVSDYDGDIENGEDYSCVINTENWF